MYPDSPTADSRAQFHRKLYRCNAECQPQTAPCTGWLISSSRYKSAADIQPIDRILWSALIARICRVPQFSNLRAGWAFFSAIRSVLSATAGMSQVQRHVLTARRQSHSAVHDVNCFVRVVCIIQHSLAAACLLAARFVRYFGLVPFRMCQSRMCDCCARYVRLMHKTGCRTHQCLVPQWKWKSVAIVLFNLAGLRQSPRQLRFFIVSASRSHHLPASRPLRASHYRACAHFLSPYFGRYFSRSFHSCFPCDVSSHLPSHRPYGVPLFRWLHFACIHAIHTT